MADELQYVHVYAKLKPNDLSGIANTLLESVQHFFF